MIPAFPARRGADRFPEQDYGFLACIPYSLFPIPYSRAT
jgi:hypothetical protein